MISLKTNMVKILLTGVLLLLSMSMTAQGEPLSLEQVLDRMEERALSIQDFSAGMEITHKLEEREQTVKAKLQASQELGLLRLELEEPNVLRGQIIVVEQETAEVKMYMPIADQIMVREAEEVGEEAGMPLDMQNLSSLFEFYDYDVEMKDYKQEEWNGESGYVYVLEVTGIEEQTQVLWLRDKDWVPYQIEVYEDERLIGTMELKDIAFDQELSRDELAELPDVREFRP